MFVCKNVWCLPDSCLTNAPEQTFVCTINLVGAMGAGLALSVKKKYPAVYRAYYKQYKAGLLQANRLFVLSVGDSRQVLMFPTKLHWKDPSPTSLILNNLKQLEKDYVDLGITSLALVPLGLGLGWNKERRLILRAIKETCERMTVPCTLYV